MLVGLTGPSPLFPKGLFKASPLFPRGIRCGERLCGYDSSKASLLPDEEKGLENENPNDREKDVEKAVKFAENAGGDGHGHGDGHGDGGGDEDGINSPPRPQSMPNPMSPAAMASLSRLSTYGINGMYDVFYGKYGLNNMTTFDLVGTKLRHHLNDDWDDDDMDGKDSYSSFVDSIEFLEDETDDDETEGGDHWANPTVEEVKALKDVNRHLSLKIMLLERELEKNDVLIDIEKEARVYRENLRKRKQKREEERKAKQDNGEGDAGVGIGVELVESRLGTGTRL